MGGVERNSNGYTPIQQAIITTLSDGQCHVRSELVECLDDELAEIPALNAHLVRLRKILRPKGEDIICELKYRKIHYRHVRLLASAYTGHR